MHSRLTTAIAAGAIGLLALSGCASSDAEGAEAQADTGDRAQLTINVFNGWPESISTAYMWQAILEERGYDITLEFTDVGIGYTGLADSAYDMNFELALPVVHQNYWDEYGDDLERLGTWYDSSPMTLAVPADSPIDSIEELAEHADEFDNRIVGIEAGAGETRIAQEDVIPAYGLENLDFVPSSTPAMLAALKKAVDNGENIVVTLWHPHWAYDSFELKDLEDPKNAWGEPSGYTTVTRTGFSDDYPQLAAWLNDFVFPDEKLTSLESVMFNPGEGDAPDEADYPDIVDDWIGDNQEWVDSLTAE